MNEQRNGRRECNRIAPAGFGLSIAAFQCFTTESEKLGKIETQVFGHALFRAGIGRLLHENKWGYKTMHRHTVWDSTYR
jgi:hypothetical protein